MPIPSTSEIKKALLELLKKERDIVISDTYEILKNHFGLSEEEFNRTYPSGNDYIFKNRIRWARQHLIDEGLAVSPEKGKLSIIYLNQRNLKSSDHKDLESINIDSQIQNFINSLNDAQKTQFQQILSKINSFF